MKYLMDTHVALWALFKSSRLPKDIQDLLSDASNDAYYSMVSVWEIAIKHKLHPDSFPVDEENFVSLADETGFLRLNITPEQIYQVKKLTRPDTAHPHNDPFDRLLIAQAIQEDMIFITHDDLLPEYEVDCIRHF